jgi:hypothetical protein
MIYGRQQRLPFFVYERLVMSFFTACSIARLISALEVG